MKIILLTISLIVGFFVITLSQNYNELPIKEEFDKYNAFLINLTQHILCTTPPSQLCPIGLDKDGGEFGDKTSKILEGYISMYEATKDKAYLNNFIWKSLCIMRKRHDIHPLATTNTNPRWSNDPQMYHDGYIIAAFSRFVHFIKVLEPYLITEPIYQFDKIKPEKHSINTCNCNYTNISFQTYGQFANWLQDRVGETLWWFIDNEYWTNSLGFIQVPGHTSPLIINQEIGFVRSCLFLGLTANEPLLLQKVSIMSNFYKENISFYDLCKLKKYDKPLFILKPNNSYYWYYWGRRIPRHHCIEIGNNINLIQSPSYDDYTKYIEDLSHGSIVTWALIDMYKYQPNTPVTLTDIIRFRNTFTKNIYVHPTTGLHNSGVDGSIGNTCIPPAHENYYRSVGTLFWAHMTEFDESTHELPKAYNILMNEYALRFTGSQTTPYPWGGSNKGHAELVKAQWERECADLTIYNRRLPYDQNFFIKGNLTIAPMMASGCSYFEPQYCENKFIIEPGASVEIISGKSVRLLPGFHAKNGSNVRISVNPLLCSSSKSSQQYDYNNYVNKEENSNITHKNDTINQTFSNEINIYPNPFSDILNVDIFLDENEAKIINLIITDNTKRILFQQQIQTDISGKQTIKIDGKNLSAGLYFLSVYADNLLIKTFKILKM